MATTKKGRREEASETGRLSPEELAALQERAREVKREARRGSGKKADREADLLAKIKEMTGSDKAMATRIHALVMEAAPSLEPKTWYGMPAWARDGKIVCFFTPAAKFKNRYASFGFEENAKLDDGPMWPTAYALLELGPAEEQRITELVKRAMG